MAAALASNGYTSSLQGLEAKRGWASVVSAENNLDAHIQSLGTMWKIAKMPTSRFHVALWFILSLMAASNFTKDSKRRGKYFEHQ
jgi:hypothetical protein